MTDNTAKEEGKSSLKTSSLKLGAKTFKPPTKKPEQIQSADVTGAYNQSPLSTLNIGYDNSTTPFQLPNTFAIPNTTGMPPLGNISAYLPNMSMPPPPPPVQTASSLSMSSISKSSLVKSSRSFVPKTLKDSTGAEMPDPKAESGKPVLKLTTKTFTPKTTATVETTEDAEKETIEVIAPAQVVKFYSNQIFMIPFELLINLNRFDQNCLVKKLRKTYHNFVFRSDKTNLIHLFYPIILYLKLINNYCVNVR